MRTSLLLSVCGLLVCLCTLPAAAAPAALKVADSYVPRVDPGYKLVPVDSGERLALGLDDALLQNAADYTGLRLDYIFRVRPGMRRRFLLTNVWNEQTMQPGPDYVEELELVPAKELPMPMISLIFRIPIPYSSPASEKVRYLPSRVASALAGSFTAVT